MYVIWTTWCSSAGVMRPSTMLFLPHACCPRGQQRSRVLTRLNCSEAEVNFQLNRDKWLCFDLLAGTTKTLCFSRRRAQQICVIWKQLFIILPYEMIWSQWLACVLAVWFSAECRLKPFTSLFCTKSVLPRAQRHLRTDKEMQFTCTQILKCYQSYVPSYWNVMECRFCITKSLMLMHLSMYRLIFFCW